MSHWPRGGIQPLLTRILAVVCLFSPLLGVAQSTDTSKVATVHVCRKGLPVIGVSLSVDGSKIGSLFSHQDVTFHVFPGYHELTLQSGEISPSALFKAEAGREYFFRLEYEQVVFATSLRGSSLSPSMQPGRFCLPPRANGQALAPINLLRRHLAEDAYQTLLVLKEERIWS
jgi:hypothetical protein